MKSTGVVPQKRFTPANRLGTLGLGAASVWIKVMVGSSPGFKKSRENITDWHTFVIRCGVVWHCAASISPFPDLGKRFAIIRNPSEEKKNDGSR